MKDKPGEVEEKVRLSIFIPVSLLSSLSFLFALWLISHSASIFVFQSVTVPFLVLLSPAALAVFSHTHTHRHRSSFLSFYRWLKRERPRGLRHNQLLKLSAVCSSELTAQLHRFFVANKTCTNITFRSKLHDYFYAACLENEQTSWCINKLSHFLFYIAALWFSLSFFFYLIGLFLDNNHSQDLHSPKKSLKQSNMKNSDWFSRRLRVTVPSPNWLPGVSSHGDNLQSTICRVISARRRSALPSVPFAMFPLSPRW